MFWLRKLAGDPLTISMCSVRLGDRLLVVGGSDTGLVAALAGKSGLTGRACMVCATEAERDRAAGTVEEAGVLVESVAAPSASLPFEEDAFDIVVMRNILAPLDPAARAGTVDEVRRVVRPGGRCISIDDAPRSGIAALLGIGQSDAAYARAGGAASLLTAAGFRGVRTLAQREALVFVEGVKPGRSAGEGQPPGEP